MRIWILSSELPWIETGGIGRYCLNYCAALSAAGHEVTLIGFSHQNRRWQTESGYQVIEMQPHDLQPDYQDHSDEAEIPLHNRLSVHPARSLQLADDILQLLKTSPAPDIIESQDFRGIAYYLLQKKLIGEALLQTIPILIHLHSPLYEIKAINQQPRYNFPDYWIGQMEKFTILAADAVLSPSRFLADSVSRSLNRELPITCLPYPADISPQPSAEVSPGELVYLGRLEIRKGVLPLIAECSELWSKGLDFRLTLIGRDTEYTPLNTTVGAYIRKKYAQWISQGRLILADELEHSEAQARVRQAWAVVIPSLWENFPNTCIEAMAAGQLVIASAQGGQAEMVETDGVNGLIFDWNRPGDLARQLERAFTLTTDQRQEMGNNARARITAYCNPPRVVEQRIEHYQQVITRHKTRRIFPSVNLSLETAALPPASATTTQRNLLSVVIPFYNLGAYVEEAVESILASTYQPLEIVIVNDGSTDEKSIEVLKKLEDRQIKNLRIVQTQNQGLAQARNAGVDAARGEFICFVDADDAIKPEFFAKAVRVLERYDNVAFVTSWVEFFGESEKLWPTWNTEFPYLLGHNMLTACAVIKRHWFDYAGRNNPMLEYSLEDYGMWLGITLKGGLGVSLPEPLIRYRIRTGSMAHRENRNERLYLYEKIAELYPDAYREWGNELFQLQNANGPAALWSTPVHQPAAQLSLAPFKHLGVTSADMSLRVAVQIIHRLRNNYLFRNLVRNSPAYRRIKRLANTFLG